MAAEWPDNAIARRVKMEWRKNFKKKKEPNILETKVFNPFFEKNFLLHSIYGILSMQCTGGGVGSIEDSTRVSELRPPARPAGEKLKC